MKAKALIFAAIIVVGAVFAFNLHNNSDPKRGLLTVEQSPYAEIRVIDRVKMRYLVIDGGIHTIADPSNWKSYFPYVAALGSLKFVFDKPGELLLIGLGGGSVVKNFAKDGWNVDVVEIDPAVTKIAYKYFGLEPSEAKIYHMDGRRFLSTHTGPYDLIVLDAYGSSYVPFHLVSKELFGLISSRLKPEGILAINIIATGWDDPIIKSLFITIKSSFKEVIALPTEESRNEFQNFILVGSNRQFDHSKGMFGNPGNYSGGMHQQSIKQLTRAWDGWFIPDTDSAVPLTDDLNSIDVQAEAVNKVLRKSLHAYFGRNGLDW